MEEGSEPCPPLEGLVETQPDDVPALAGMLLEGSEAPMIEGTDEMDAQLMRMLQEGTQASQDDLLPSNITFLDSQADTGAGVGQRPSTSQDVGELRVTHHAGSLNQGGAFNPPNSFTTVDQPGQRPQQHAAHSGSVAGRAAASSIPSSQQPTLAPKPASQRQLPSDMHDMGMDIEDDMLQEAYLHESEMQQYINDMQDEAGTDLLPDDFQLDNAASPMHTGAAGPAGGAAPRNLRGVMNVSMPPPPRRPPGQQQHTLQPSNAAAHPAAAAVHVGSRAAQNRTPQGAAATAPDKHAAAAGKAGAIEAHIDALFGDDTDAVVDGTDAMVEEEEPVDTSVPDVCQPPRLLACDIIGECVPVTSASGLRVYCATTAPQDDARRLQWQDVLQSSAGRAVGAARPSGRRPGQPRRMHLLSRPISDMMRDAQELQLQAAVQESRRMAAEAADGQAAALTTPGRNAVGAAGSPPHQQHSSQPGDELLWVAKYAPRKFMSLLSDEQTNRQVAKWMKAWDAVVFGLPQPQQRPAQGARYGGPGARQSGGAMAAGSRAAVKGQRLGVDQQDTRPERKVILLCGPPGTGKTTLAHVVAQHCGYHPFEINASDDRTADTLTQRVTDAVQMQPVLGERKPNCVIIDEIDGATGGAEGHSAISALLTIINAGSKPAGEEGSKKASSKKGGRKGKALPPLSRPIICIANDLYAPALRPLRDVAQVFHFKAPDLDKLVARLQHICSLEGINVDKPALISLAQRCDCDIRTCLNTLQFLAKQHGVRSTHRHTTPGRVAPAVAPVTPGAAAAKAATPATSPARAGRTGGNPLASPPPRTSNSGRGVVPPTTPAARTPRRAAKITVQQIEQLPIGSKDTSKGIFSAWDAMLHLPRQGGAGAGGGGSTRWRRTVMSDVHKLLQDVGEYELIMAGLQENLLNVRYLDVHLKNTAQMMDAMADADILLHSCRRRVDFSMLSYVPARLLVVHHYAAQHEKPHLQWPKALTDCSRRAAAHQELLRSWAGCKVAGRVLQAHHIHNLSLDLMPALLRLLSPIIRPLAPNLLNPAEQAHMQSCVHALVDFGLRFGLDEDARPVLRANPTTDQAPRPVPLDPALDCMHVYNSPRLLRGHNALRPVPLVLRQMLNQQATLESIRRTQANHVEDEDTDMPDAAAVAETSAVGRLLGVHAAPAVAAAKVAGKQPLAAQDSNARQDSKPAPGAAVPAKPGHWLDALRLSATNKRKAQAASARQMNKKQATGDLGGDNPVQECTSPTGKAQFPVLYRYNEGYTNAVKRPLLMKELL